MDAMHRRKEKNRRGTTKMAEDAVAQSFDPNDQIRPVLPRWEKKIPSRSFGKIRDASSSTSTLMKIAEIL